MPLRKRKIYSGYTYPNKVSLIRGGKDYFNTVVGLIDKATEIIHLQTYIFNNDETGMMVTDALLKANERGVKVYVVLDGYASQSLDKKFIADIRATGIRLKFFEPLFRSRNFYFGRRMHHKVMVVDDRFSLVGGVNISNRYNDIDGEKAWLDFAVLTEGPTSAELSVLCWKTINGFLNKGRRYQPIQQSFDFDSETNLAQVRMRRNDWVKNKNEISKTYLELFRTAKDEIIILCSYFIPGNAIRRAMVNAVKRGVNIKVIMTGMSDVPVAKNAERYMYSWLLRNHIEIYEYQENVLHGKIAVSDQQFTTIGSYNINDISAFASIELNLDVKSEQFSEKVHYTLKQILETQCIQIDSLKHSTHLNIFRMFFMWISYQFVRIVFYLFTFYFRQEKRRA